MIKFLVKKFVPDYENVSNSGVREKYGILGGILGIICNFFLFSLKLTVGLLMNSISVISDAFNNLSDTASSLIVIVGTKLSNMRPDEEHPFGHGRIEYISSLIVSFIIMLVGFELFKSSLSKIFTPQPVAFSLPLIIILGASVLVKLWMASYNRWLSGRISSGVLRAAATDSLIDAVSTSIVVISIIVGRFVSFPLDAIFGAIFSLLVIYSGFGIAKDTVDVLLGTAPDMETVDKITEKILQAEGIIGVHDLIVHDYGPGRKMASVHAEVPDTADIVKIHELIDRLEQEISRELGVHTVIHMDPIATGCETTDRIKAEVLEIIKSVDESMGIHDFRMTDGESNINLIFDLEMPFALQKDKDKILSQIKEKLSERDSRYAAVITVDSK